VAGTFQVHVFLQRHDTGTIYRCRRLCVLEAAAVMTPILGR